MVARSGNPDITFYNYAHRDEARRRMRRLSQQPLPETRHSSALSALAHLAELRMCLAVGERGQAAAAVVVAGLEGLLAGTGEAAVSRWLVLLDGHRYDQARAAVAPVRSGEQPAVVVTTAITAWLIEALGNGTRHAAGRLRPRTARPCALWRSARGRT